MQATCPEALVARLRELNLHEQACRRNGEAGFGVVEADFLFCFVATHRPPRIVQIGCAGQNGEIPLIKSKVEEADFDIAGQMAAGDLFFVDSTHTLGPAGEVTRIILELLPLLPAGAWVHFHDILFPYDYPRRLLSSELFFGHESALLLAFLTYNRRFAIAASLSMLHYACADELKQSLPNYRPAVNDQGLQTVPGHFPSSTYLKTLA